jgi:polar amino acid transport system permease protein
VIGIDTDMIARYGPLLLAGLATTLRVCTLAAVIALVAGLALALLLRARPMIVRAAARTYVEVMRGTPILVILFLLYYGGPSVGLVLDAEPVGILGLGFYGAGYFAEIFRAGFESIPRGQIEAARMVGLTSRQIVRRIQIPQMLGLIVPPSVNQIIILVKESAVLSIITVAELTKNATQMANETFAVVEPFLAVALLYWALIEAIALSGRWIERRVRHA